MDPGAKAAALSNEQKRSCSRPMMVMRAAAQGQKTGVDLSGSAIVTLRDLPEDGFLITNSIMYVHLDTSWQVADISPQLFYLTMMFCGAR